MPFPLPSDHAPMAPAGSPQSSAPTDLSASTLDDPPAGLDRRDWIAGLARGIGIIESFDSDHPRMTASEVGQRTGLTRTAARRYLLTLQAMGYVAGDGKLFWLTPRVMRLGQSYLESTRLARVVQPFLQRVSASTHETVYLSVLDGDEVVYIARNGPNRNMNTGYVLGARVTAEVTAAGLLMLALRPPELLELWLASYRPRVFTPYTIASAAQLRQSIELIRAQDWALSEQQLDMNSRGIAVPLRDRHGTLQGALNITMPVGREGTAEAVQRVLPALRETAEAMRNLL